MSIIGNWPFSLRIHDYSLSGISGSQEILIGWYLVKERCSDDEV